MRTAPGRDGTLSAAGQRKPFPTGKKPDVDNALKLLMDALNGKAYRDDVDVVDARVRRVWSFDGWERTRVQLAALDDLAVTALATERAA
jgi:Holliday junction resolvase RusA-like endonuclease